ncbi:hypothetical protein PG995_007122 [Apiospora arundinis]
MLGSLLLAAGLVPCIIAKPISLAKSATSTDDIIIYGKELPTHSELWDFPTITMRRSRTSIVPLPTGTEDDLDLPFKKRAMDVPSLTDDIVLPTSTYDIIPSVTVTDGLPLETDDLDLPSLDERAMALPSVTLDDFILPTETNDILPSLTLADNLPLETDDLDLNIADKRAITIPSVTRKVILPTVTHSLLPSLTLTDDLPLETDDLGLPLDVANEKRGLMNHRPKHTASSHSSHTKHIIPSLTISLPHLPLETDDLDIPLDNDEKRDLLKPRPTRTTSTRSSHSSHHLPSLTVSRQYLPLETDDLDLPLLDTNDEEKRDAVNYRRPTTSRSHSPSSSHSSSSSHVLPFLPLETAAAADPDLDFAMNGKRQATGGDADKRIKPSKALPSITAPSSVSSRVLPKPSVTAPPHVHTSCSDCGTKCTSGKDVDGILKCVEKCVADCLAHLPIHTGSVVANSLSKVV